MHTEYPNYSRTTSTKQKRRKHTARIVVIPLGIAAVVTAFILVAHGQTVTNAKDSVTVSNAVSESTTQKVTTKTVTPSTLQTQLTDAWTAIANERVGDVDIAVYNNQTGETTHYTNAINTLNTASIVKLAIAEALLLQTQNNDTTLTATQTADLTSMLENSDNAAATTLWNEVGGKTGMNTFFKTIGATSTTAGTDGYWGLTQTSALDQLKIMNIVAYPGTPLSTTSAETINDILDNVEPDQAWGVSAGLAAGADYKLKNGWLEDAQTDDSYSDTASWTVNSIGHITADGVDYTISVLTEGQTTEAYGIETIEEVSKATWASLK